MTIPSFNPEEPVLEIPFTPAFAEAKNNERSVRFGPVDGKVTFDIESVSDTTTGRELPIEVFRLKDQGADGEGFRQVLVVFDGQGFTQQFQAETEPATFLARLKNGLFRAQSLLSDKQSIEQASLSQVLDTYNLATEALAGTYEPLFGALTSGTTLAIRAIVPELKNESSAPTAVTLYIRPRPVSAEG